jgi:signal transduction histidine kinase
VAVALRKPLAAQAEGQLPPPDGRRRISILVEFLAALASVVLISAAGTGIFEERLTRSALAREADLLASSRLSVVVAAYENREETLAITLRYLAERLNVSGATDPEGLTDLVAQLSLTGSSLDIDMLGVFERDGRFVAGEGRFLENSPVVTEAAAASRSRLVPAPDGTHKRVLATPIGTDEMVLVGGLDLSDDTALELRKTLGDGGQVILVAGSKVVGSSISLSDEGLPGADPETGKLPTEPRLVDLGGKSMLLAYESLAGPAEPLGAGAVGVAVPDPVGGLTESLTLVRFLSTLVLTGVAVAMGWLLFWTLIRPLVGLARTASRIARGDLNATFVAPRNNEIGRLAGALQQMTAELQGQTRRLQEASKRLLVAQQEERQRMARDLHDGMQQQLVVLAVKIKQLAASEEPPNPLILEHLAAEAEEAAFALQDLGRGIFPTVLGDQGVPAALRTSASRLPMKVRLDVGPELEEARFSPEIEGTLYFVTMEAMANAQKHAPEAQLTIRLSGADGAVLLEVSDDGPGFDAAEESLGAGLQNMADRVNAVGGSFTLTTAPGAGVRILAKIPLDAVSS